MGVRWYDAQLGRWISADTIVPDLANSQSLNRFAYVGNNPVLYVDPNGHAAWIPFFLVLVGAYAGGRGAYEVASVVFIDSDRRDQIGGQLVADVSETIRSESASHCVDPTLVGAVLRHESAAFERRLWTLWPTMQPGAVANALEYLQSALPEDFSIGPMQTGDMASLGPAQMQLRRARELEELGYVTPRSSDAERRKALLGRETSVEYVAGMLQYLTDQLSTLREFSDLSAEDQQRVILIGYNWGWEGLQDYYDEYGFYPLIQTTQYDNETLDEYQRWSSGQ
jgi:hypothetical protein